MTVTTQLKAHSRDHLQNLLLMCGVIGPTLFVIAFFIEGAVRPNYNPLVHWVSHLSLGEQGLINNTLIVLTGLQVVLFAIGVHGALPTGTGSTWGPILIATSGIGLLLAGVFVTDPGLGYPPGVSASETPSLHSNLHDLSALVFYGSLSAACFVLARAFAEDARWRKVSSLAGVLVIVFLIATSVLVSLHYAGVYQNGPSGLLERITIITGCAWLIMLAYRLLPREARRC